METLTIAIGALIVAVAEKSLAAEHAPDKNRIIVGLVFGAPFLIVAILLNRRKQAKAAKSKPAPRPYSPFGPQR